MELNSSEHFEKRNKEFSPWIEELCRTCNHKRLFHLWNESNLLGGKYLHGNCNFLLEIGGFCLCSEWMSPDNLDYIELLAKRKGLISDEEDKI